MERILFSNRMGGRNLVYLVIGYVIAIVVILAIRGGDDIGPVLAVLAVLTVLGIVAVLFIFTVVAKDQIAELKQTGNGLRAEMVHISGKGRIIEMPMPGPQDWGCRVQGVGTRGMKKVAILTFKSGDTFYTLPIAGASIVDLEGLRALAPRPVEDLLARGLISQQPK